MSFFPSLSLYQGDCLKVLQTLPSFSVDMVLTDPPYASGGQSTSARQHDPAQKYQTSGTKRTYPPMLGDSKDQRSWVTWCTLWLSECWRIARDGAPLLVFSDWRQLPALTDAVQGAGWTWRSIVVWNKNSCRPMIGRFRQQAEFIVFASKGPFIATTRQCLPGMFSHSVVATKKVHLTSKPVELIQDLLMISKEKCVVLDPFMGGGTTGVACVATGRHFVGIELSTQYFEIAKARIDAEALNKQAV